jgi:tetratricopeptide (TPR) repeat protein
MSLMKRRLSIIAIVVCLLSCAHDGAAAKETWTSVRSRNFFLIGNASDKDIRQVATRLEQFRDVFTRLFPNVEFNSPVPTTVVVFKSDGSYKPFKPVVNGKVSDVAGYFQPGDDVNYITLTTEKRSEDPYATIYHEYVHLLVDNNIGRTAAPPWFNEGLAEYYSALDIDDARKVHLGNLINNHLLLLRQQEMFPLKALFDVDYHSLHRNNHAVKGLFYAQSWALVHYLILGNDGQRLTQLGRFLSLRSKDVPTEKAFQEAFQTDFAGMEKELKKYVEGHSFRRQVATFERKLEFDTEMQSAPLSEAEVESYLGDLLLHTDRLDEAAARLRRALELDPKSGMAHASLGMVMVRQRRFGEAKQHLQQAVAADARNYLAHYYYAYTLSREGMDEAGRVAGYTAETAREMRGALRRAIELKPDFPESYHLLAWVNLVTDEQLDEAIRLLERARALSPGSQEYAFVLAQIHLRRQNFDAARRAVEPLAHSGSDPQMRANAQSLLNAISSMEEQLARLKAERERGVGRGDGQPESSSGQPPRLRKRDGMNPATGAGASDEEMSVVQDDPLSALHQVLRKPLEGEVRVQGLLTSIDCNSRGLVFIIKVGERLLKLQSAGFDSLHLVAYTPEAQGELTCGARKPENAVVVTYRPSKDAKAKVDGAMTAMEFVPAGFVLKQ